MTLGKEKIDVSAALSRARTTLDDDPSLSASVRSLIELLIVIIELLVAKLGINSTNSSTPPSQDPNRRRGSKGNRDDSVRRNPGGQHGHAGSTLQPVAEPDHVETLKLDRRRLPRGEYRDGGFEARQLFEIEIHRRVTEYRAEILIDAEGRSFLAEFPAGVTRPAQYGASVKAHAVYLSQHQLLPYERIREHLAEQYQLPVSAGSLYNFNREAFERLETFEAIVRRELIGQRLVNADETGINVNGSRLWLHCLSNDHWTLFHPHARRGVEAMNDMGVLAHFEGILCHDHWKPYFTFTCTHALCNAHHLRELERAWEYDGQHWAKRMQALLLEINKATTDAGGAVSAKAAKAFRRRYRKLLAGADAECPPPDPSAHAGKRGRPARSKSRNLLERLREFETETLRFMHDPEVPFTNNLGENDLRMTKVQQKISGCFRSMHGAKIFCRVRSYLSTCRKHGVSATEALRILFSGRLPEFLVKLE